MNIFKKQLIVLATALCIAPIAGFAQYQFELKPFLSYFKDAKRYELSFNYVMPQGYFYGTSQVKNGTYVGDTTIKRTNTATGIGGSIGLTLPFKATGHISCWAMSLHLMVNELTWNDINSTYGTEGSAQWQPFGINSMVAHHPVYTYWQCDL